MRSKNFLKKQLMNKNFVFRLFGLVILLILFHSSDISAQILRGHVSDQTTGEPLPAATVQVAGTYTGTITNNEGEYAISVDKLPVDIVVRYIGFRTDTLTAHTLTPLEFRLEPVTFEMEQIVVTDEDPANWIMRQVIERKQIWREQLQTFEAQAYTRYTISNDSGIVAITESAATAWWDKKLGFREEIKGVRSTGNWPLQDALPAAQSTVNLYDDNIFISGHTLIGVTHPDALDRYVFTLEGTRRVDEAIVYDITVEPRSRQSSAFIGDVSVLDGEFALIEAKLRPGPAFIFPYPIQRYETIYLQQFSSYGGEVWFPVDLRSNSIVEISFGVLLSFPLIHIDLVSRFTDYQLNVVLPDSLFKEDYALQVDSSAVASGESFQREGVVVPLTPGETLAYESIDSTYSLQEAYKPKGSLGRAINRAQEIEERRSSTQARLSIGELGLRPHLWYNRVDALYGGIEYKKEFGEILEIQIHAGLNSGQKGDMRALYKGAVRFGRDWFVDADYHAENASTYQSNAKFRFTNSLLMLLGQDDYFDYYRREGVSVGVGHQMNWNSATITVRYLHEIHSALAGNVSYDFFGRDAMQRPNSFIPEGEMQSVQFEFRIGQNSSMHFGPQRHFLFSAEFSIPQSDFTFQRYYLNAGGRVNTFLRRRFLPATLDYGVSIGLASDLGRDLPPQRTFIVEGGTTVYHPGGVLHTLRGLPYQGNGLFFGYWEHNFRTLPFELLGLGSIVRRGHNIVIFGGHALIRGTQSMNNNWIRHNELGVSLSGIFGVVRLNVAYHIEDKQWSPSLSVARIF